MQGRTKNILSQEDFSAFPITHEMDKKREIRFHNDRVNLYICTPGWFEKRNRTG